MAATIKYFTTDYLEQYLKTLEKETLLSRGWQIIMVGYSEGKRVIDLHYKSDKGGGSYAAAKIRTLEMLPDLLTTDTDIDAYKAWIQKLSKKTYATSTSYASLPILSAAECKTFFTQLEPYTRLEDVPREILDPIRDRTGLSPFGGGIRLTWLNRADEAANECPLELLVAMSGAKESGDDLAFGLKGVQHFISENLRRIFVDWDRLEDAMAALYLKSPEAWRMVKLL